MTERWGEREKEELSEKIGQKVQGSQGQRVKEKKTERGGAGEKERQ